DCTVLLATQRLEPPDQLPECGLPVSRERPQVVDEVEPLLGGEARDPLVETPCGDAGQLESIEATTARVRVEPARPLEPKRRALGREEHPLLLRAVAGAVPDDERYRPELAGRLRVGVGEVSALRQRDLEPAVALASFGLDERMTGFLDPRVRDLGDVLARRGVQLAPEVVGRSVRLGIAAQV